MIDPVEVLAKEFEDSHLYNKMRKIVIVSRIFESKEETSSVLYAARGFDLGDSLVFEQVKADYETARQALRTGGLQSLASKMGILVQPRTKGAGHGSVSRAFYARTPFVAQILDMVSPVPVMGNVAEPLPEESEPSS